jgi:nucleoside-diphosphate-sugar epimerase
VDVRIIRIFNTYGPRMRLNDGRVVPNFISQALRGEDLTVYGDGTQTRSFCYIDNLIEGIFRVSVMEDIDGEVLNLGNPEEYRIIDFAKTIIEKTGSKSGITSKPLPQDDPKRRCPDITKAKDILGWEAEIPLDEGLEYTIGYFKSRLAVKQSIF